MQLGVFVGHDEVVVVVREMIPFVILTDTDPMPPEVLRSVTRPFMEPAEATSETLTYGFKSEDFKATLRTTGA